MPREEVYSQEAEGTFVAFPMRCHACKARDMAQDEFEKNKGNTAGLRFGLRRRG